MEVANWIGANIHRTSLRLGLRSEASTRFEKQLQPEQAMEAQAVATKLMVDLCGARARPRDDRHRRSRAGAADDPAARCASREPARNRRSRASAVGASWKRSSSRPADAGDGLDVKPPPFRRDDVTREADLIEEVARIDGLEKLPATLPSAPRRLGPAHDDPAASPARRRRADRPGTRRGRSAGASPGPNSLSGCGSKHRTKPSNWRTRCRPSSPSCGRRCWGRCSTSPRATSPAAPRRSGCSRQVPSTCPTRTASSRASPTTSGRCSLGAVRPADVARPGAADRRLLRREGRARGTARHASRAAGPSRAERPSRSFIRAGRRRSSPAGDRWAGSARSIRRWPRSGTSARRSRPSSSISTPRSRTPC